jgi:hypothetical protein
MNKLYLIATILVGILFCTNCSGVKTIVVNVEKPAQLTLPPTIRNIGIVNNAVPQADFWGHYGGWVLVALKTWSKKEIPVSSDSVCSILAESLYEGLINLNTFDTISLYEDPLRDDLFFLYDQPIDTLDARELCKTLNADGLISIDRFLTTSSSRTVPYDYDLDLHYLDVKMDALFRIYSREGKLLSAPLYFTDSIFWEAAYSPSNNYLLSRDSIPTREEALKQAAAYAGEKVAAAFGSTWVNQSRTYYTGYKDADLLAESNRWLEAMAIWMNAFNTETKPAKKARLANNIALAYELSDDIKNAIQWVVSSVQLFEEAKGNKKELAMAQYYRMVLTGRYNDFRLLDISKK